LLWDVHGGYTDALVSGRHTYLFPPPDENGGGLRRLRRLDAVPAGCHEVSWSDLAADPPDLVLLQRPIDADLCEQHLGLRPGRDLPGIYLEHNTPQDQVPNTRHPLADQSELLLVQVTHVNHLFWDTGSATSVVIEHGVPDPGYRYRGDLARLAFVVNEPVRRWRVTGTDLLAAFGAHPIDAFGIDGDLLPPELGSRCPQLVFAGNLSPEDLYTALARRRVYLHLNRWTSLGLSLIQAMMLGMPVVVVNTTEASRAVPPEAGALSSDVGELTRAAAQLLKDPEEAAARGRVAREAALRRYGLARFLADWDEAYATAQKLVK
jgi:hypothetical protein